MAFVPVFNTLFCVFANLSVTMTSEGWQIFHILIMSRESTVTLTEGWT